MAEPAVVRASASQDESHLSTVDENSIGLEIVLKSTLETGRHYGPIERIPSVCEPMNRIRLIVVCLASLANGFSDAGAGAVIPYVET